MAEHRLIYTVFRFAKRLALCMVAASLVACSAPKPDQKLDDRIIKENIPRTPKWDIEPPQAEPSPPPPFTSMTEEIVPLKTRTVNIVVRNSTLGDVLHVLADASGLNLLIDKDVYLDQPVTLSLRNALAEDALKTIFSNLDCFYSIENNVLKVESLSTRIFELGHPALANTYTMNIGGNISGSGMSGAITSSSTADAKAQDFWGSLEKALLNVMEMQETPAGGSAKTAETVSASQQQTGKGSVSGTVIDEPTGTTVNIKTNATPLNRYIGGRQRQNITINRMTGTIMVTASKKTMEKVESYIETVRKVLNRGVMIEARIIEVQLSDSLKYGIDWTFLDSSGGGSLLSGFGTLNPVNSSISDASSAAASASKFQMGISRSSFKTLLTALQTQGDVKILSNPKISVMNGHTSILTVGTNTSFISKVTSTTTTGVGTSAANSITFTPETSSVLSGMIIGIVPYISEKGDITLNVTPITSDLTKLDDKTFGTGGNQVTITIPTVALREMTTTVKMRDGQMVIIGGLISKKESRNEEKVPLLGSIPYLGKLFTRINNSESKSELVILLRPSIVDNE